MKIDDTAAVATIFGESDAGELPHLVGVTRRTLFRFNGLYLHLVETRQDGRAQVGEVRGHQLFLDVSEKLEPFIEPYDPGWHGPSDAMAEPFYSWES